MSAEVYVQPADGWQFFMTHIQQMKTNEVVLAEDELYSITMTEHEMFPQITVSRGESQTYQELTVSEKDCRDTMSWLYARYLGIIGEPEDEIVLPDMDYEEDDEPDGDPQFYEDEYYMRDDEIEQAFMDFLEVLLQEDIDSAFAGAPDKLAEVKSECIDHACEMLADVGISVYRPYYYKDEDTGETVFVRYPYDKL